MSTKPPTKKRAAASPPSAMPPPAKLLRTNNSNGAAIPASPIPPTPTSLPAADKETLMTTAKEAAVQATTYAHTLSSIIEGLILQAQVEQMEASKMTIGHAMEVRKLREELSAQAEELVDAKDSVEELKEEARERVVSVRELWKEVEKYEQLETKEGAKLHFDAKVKELRAEHSKATTEMQKKHTAAFKAKDAYWKERHDNLVKKYQAKLDEIRSSHKEEMDDIGSRHKREMTLKDMVYQDMMSDNKIMVKSCEQKLKELKESHKVALKSKEEKLKELHKAKELVWKNDMSELRAKHREEMAKVRANVKMVEAAQKVVQLNAGAGKSSEEADGQDPVKVE